MKPKLLIIKIGGNVLDNPEALETFLDDFAAFGTLKILVHGGGKIASTLASKLGIAQQLVNGRRITDAETLDLVTMVYGGLINKNIVAKLQARKCNALGICGADGNILPAVKRAVNEIDYGFVGDIDYSDLSASRIQLLLDTGLSMVIAPLTHDKKGKLLNTNADTIASCLARVLSFNYTSELVYCFEKEGVLDASNMVIPIITPDSYKKLLSDKVVSDGMIPKIDNSFDALNAGVSSVRIMQAASLSLLRKGKNPGTIIRKE